VRTWDAAAGQIIQILPHERSVNGALWNAAEDRVLMWERANTARVWDTTTTTACLLPHDGTVNGAVWARAGEPVLSWASAGRVRVWDDPCSGVGQVVLTYDRSVDGAKWNRDETRILSWSSDNTVRIWDADSQTATFIFRHGGPVNHADWSQDESKIISTSLDNVVQIWSATAHNPQVRQPVLDLPHPQRVSGAVWNNDQTRIL